MADAEDVPPILLPCAICARTFKPQTLEKHIKICERTAVKKRKPFDSAKQRVHGTDLAEFLPKHGRRRVAQEEKSQGKPKSSWKQTHDEFVRAIRAARGEVDEVSPPPRHAAPVVPATAPTRANEKGMCPTCNRQFGIKAYDRHVAWCKERANRLPVSPATNIAKERLEARIKYRAPALKNRRLTNREKYSPGSAVSLTGAGKASPPAVATKAKESASVPTCNKGNDSPVKPKPAVVRRPGQNREPPVPSGPIKSRLVDRTNRPDCDSGPATSRSTYPSRRRSNLPVPPTKLVKVKNPSPLQRHPMCSRKHETRPNAPPRTDQSPRSKHHDQTAKVKQSLVSARGYNNPRLNDVAVNEDVIGMTVQPCNIYDDHNMVTWKQISDEKGHAAEEMKMQSRELENNSAKRICGSSIERTDRERNERHLDHDSGHNLEAEKLSWTEHIQKLDKTYLITESGDTEIEYPAESIVPQKWKPVKNSPRVEFCVKEMKSSSKLETLSEKYDYRSLDSPTDFNDNVNFTSTPMPSRNDKLGSENDIAFDCIDLRGPTGWSGGLKMPEPPALDLGLLEPYEEEPVLQKSSRNQSPKTMKSAKIKSPPTGKKKRKPVIKRTPRLKPVTDRDAIIEEPLNFRNHEYDYETPRGSRPVLKRPDYEAEVSSPKKRGSTNSTSPGNKRKTKTSTKTTRSNQGSPMRSSATPTSPRSPRSPRTLRTPRSHDKNRKRGNSSQSPFICRSAIPRSPPEVPFDTIQKFDRTFVACNSQMLTDQLLADAAFEEKLLKDMSLDINTAEINIDSSFTNSTKSRSTVRDSESVRMWEQFRSKNFCENENCACEPLEDPVREPGAFGNADVQVQPEEKTGANSELKQECLPEKDYSEIVRDTGCNSVKLDGTTRRRCGTYVIEKLPDTSKKHLEEKPAGDQNDPDSTNDCDEHNDSLNSTAMSKTFLEMSNEDDVTIGDEMRQIYDKYINNNFNYDSDNTVVDTNIKDLDNDEPVVFKDVHAEEESVFDDSAKAITYNPQLMPKLRSTKSGTQELNVTDAGEMQKRMRENMNLLRGSTDTLISSADATPLGGTAALFAGPYDREACTIQTISCVISTPVQFLPQIKQELGIDPAKSHVEKRLRAPQSTYWERAAKVSQKKLITLDPPKEEVKFMKKNPRIKFLPPMIPTDFAEHQSGAIDDYDPFLAAERQMNELFSDTSDVADSPAPARDYSSTREQNQYPLSHSSAFVKYPSPPTNKRASVIAPPSEFDDFTSDFSSDSTETNSLSQEIFINNLNAQTREVDSRLEKQSREPVRRVVIDKSKAASANDINSNLNRGKSFISSAEKTRKILEKVSPKIIRPTVNRSHSVRVASAPKAPERKTSSNPVKKANSQMKEYSNMSNNNYAGISGSNLSLSSVLSSEVDIKRSNSVFDDLLSSFEDDGTSFPSLKSFLKSDSMSSPIQGSRHHNGQVVSDEELSSPDSYKRQDHSKLSADSAYSSLNRKCSNHGRSTNDVATRHEEEAPRRRDVESAPTKMKLSKFCHECGSRFPDTAKFCCECGVRRLAL